MESTVLGCTVQLQLSSSSLWPAVCYKGRLSLGILDPTSYATSISCMTSQTTPVGKSSIPAPHSERSAGRRRCLHQGVLTSLPFSRAAYVPETGHLWIVTNNPQVRCAMHPSEGCVLLLQEYAHQANA